jgi:hypothetical protein
MFAENYLMILYQDFGTEGQNMTVSTLAAAITADSEGCEDHGNLRWKSVDDLYSTL